MEESFTITFDHTSVGEATQLSNELQQYLLETVDLPSSIEKERDDTQDAGAILTILLSSTSIVSIAKGLSAWLLKKQSRKITIKKNGDIIGEGLSSGDIVNILHHLK